MIIKEAIYELVNEFAPTYYAQADQAASRPLLVISQTGGNRLSTFDAPVDLRSAEISISAWGNSVKDADELAQQLDVLEGFAGTVGTIAIQGIFELNDSDLYEDPDGQSRGVFGKERIFTVWYKEI